jgi:hypothetical protein
MTGQIIPVRAERATIDAADAIENPGQAKQAHRLTAIADRWTPPEFQS